MAAPITLALRRAQRDPSAVRQRLQAWQELRRYASVAHWARAIGVEAALLHRALTTGQLPRSLTRHLSRDGCPVHWLRTGETT